ncbi:hypothetical protein BDV38DRAFT_1987 [Aspergillus pseudotamarii]|uniref:Uncharacterized protein n=1 Tax=Aspergillus pseudotamarii TaxID=132259 RepID=A0A5N6TBN0_ASPPS|nr:uncharacterized protein BDV38DRAFT_1987 [Aspergillus pseudotamarii]KAE8143706.1 hypothetical protein BDV38DRAFT_1987 [Aspergillus pseudotamarii]
MGEIGEFWRDVKEDRKRKKRENPPHRRCWDWIIVSGHCHYAKNRSSFVTYRRVGRVISQGFIGGETFVAGMGTVILKVRASKKKGSPIRTLVLDDVLHIPSAICNGFCFAKYHTVYGGTASLGLEFSGTDPLNYPLWYGKPFCEFQKLVLAGNPQGETYLEYKKKEGVSLLLSMYINKKDLEEIR